jgi:hypothetical protein
MGGRIPATQRPPWSALSGRLRIAQNAWRATVMPSLARRLPAGGPPGTPRRGNPAARPSDKERPVAADKAALLAGTPGIAEHQW